MIHARPPHLPPETRQPVAIAVTRQARPMEQEDNREKLRKVTKNEEK
jgi:hypothetical protein